MSSFQVSEQIAALSQRPFDEAAQHAASELERLGSSYVSLQPGDATDYIITIVRPQTMRQQQRHVSRPDERPEFSDRLMVGTSFGPVYELVGCPGEAGYVYDKWTRRNGTTDVWTSHVLLRFFQALTSAIASRTPTNNGEHQ